MQIGARGTALPCKVQASARVEKSGHPERSRRGEGESGENTRTHTKKQQKSGASRRTGRRTQTGSASPARTAAKCTRAGGAASGGKHGGRTRGARGSPGGRGRKRRPQVRAKRGLAEPRSLASAAGSQAGRRRAGRGPTCLRPLHAQRARRGGVRRPGQRGSVIPASTPPDARPSDPLASTSQRLVLKGDKRAVFLGKLGVPVILARVDAAHGRGASRGGPVVRSGERGGAAHGVGERGDQEQSGPDG